MKVNRGSIFGQGSLR